MLDKITEDIENQLSKSDTGLYCEYKPGYFAYASEVENGYIIEYCKDAMPAYLTESFGNVSECANEMVKTSMNWRETEE